MATSLRSFSGDRTGRTSAKDVMLPMTVLRRLDCVLEKSKDKVLEKHKILQGSKLKDYEWILNREASYNFHNISKFTFKRLQNEPDKIAANLTNHIKGFSSKAREKKYELGVDAG